MVNYLEQLGIREESPLVSLSHKDFLARGLKVYVKQEYLLHPSYGGNKWRKLKYNIKDYLAGGYNSLWTFGGAFSNHIHAVAGICHALGIPCHGIIRDSLAPDLKSATLEYAQSQGMQLHMVSRTAYRDKAQVLAAQSVGHSKVFAIPEGGSNALALKGVGEIIAEVANQLEQPPDYWVCAAGSGGTAAGLLQHLPAKQQLLVFPALKGDWMRSTILNLLTVDTAAAQLKVIPDFHFGGYAKFDERLISFMKKWYAETGIPLDPIYNGKSFFGFCELVEQGYFPAGSSIVLIHSGGLQGIPSFNNRNALQLPMT